MCIYLDYVYKLVAWDDNTVGSSRVSDRLQRKIRFIDDLSIKELDSIEYSWREQSDITQTRVRRSL